MLKPSRVTFPVRKTGIAPSRISSSITTKRFSSTHTLPKFSTGTTIKRFNSTPKAPEPPAKPNLENKTYIEEVPLPSAFILDRFYERTDAEWQKYQWPKVKSYVERMIPGWYNEDPDAARKLNNPEWIKAHGTAWGNFPRKKMKTPTEVGMSLESFGEVYKERLDPALLGFAQPLFPKKDRDWDD